MSRFLEFRSRLATVNRSYSRKMAKPWTAFGFSIGPTDGSIGSSPAELMRPGPVTLSRQLCRLASAAARNVRAKRALRASGPVWHCVYIYDVCPPAHTARSGGFAGDPKSSSVCSTSSARCSSQGENPH